MGRIVGIAYHLPEEVETNEDLGRSNPDWRIDSLYEKTGIRSRHIAAADETASDLGLKAAQRLLQRQLVDPTTIDFLIYCTQSPDHFLPPASCVLQHRLGFGRHLGALDMNLGCSGFVYGLQLANSLVESSAARNVLLITADTYTKYIHPRDRSVRALFGDGAAATLVGSSDSGCSAIGEFEFGTDGTGAANLIVPSGGFRLPRSPETQREYTDSRGCTRSQDNLFMDGSAVFAFALATVPRTISALLEKANLPPDAIDYYIYHQANKYMLEALARRSNIPMDKIIIAMEDTGNTVSPSIPIATQRHVEFEQIRPGHLLMMIGFGVGYSWGACIVRWT